MSFLGLRRIIVFFIINNFLSTTKYFNLKRNLLLSLGYNIGKNTKIVGPLFITSKLTIGDDCWIGRDFKCYGNGHVFIGNRCDIAPNVSFSTGGHKIGSSLRRAGDGEIYDIIVGDGVWLCVNSTICKNTTIGDSSVIAACSCVVKDVEKNVIVGGVPAKIIKRLDDKDD